MVTAKEKDFSLFVNELVRFRITDLPYSYGKEDIAQEIMLGLWKLYGEDWIISEGKNKYYSFILAIANNQAVNAKRKVYGRYDGKTAKFEYKDAQEERRQAWVISPDFYAELTEVLEAEYEKSTRDADVADSVFMKPGVAYKKAKEFGLSPSRMTQVSSEVRRSVLRAMT